MFKPFVVKKDAEVAPLNWFLDSTTNKLHRRKGNKDVIVIDDDDAGLKREIVDEAMEDIQEVEPSVVRQMNTRGRWSNECLSLR